MSDFWIGLVASAAGCNDMMRARLQHTRPSIHVVTTRLRGRANRGYIRIRKLHRHDKK